MAITYRIEKRIPTSRRHQSAWLVLENDKGQGSYRRVEVTRIPNSLTDDAELRAYIDERLTAANLWRRGQDAEVTQFEKADERGMEGYYRGILRAIEKTRRSKGTLDMALAAGLEAIGRNKRKQADFDTYRSWAGLENPQTAFEDTMLLLLMQNFALQELIID